MRHPNFEYTNDNLGNEQGLRTFHGKKLTEYEALSSQIESMYISTAPKLHFPRGKSSISFSPRIPTTRFDLIRHGNIYAATLNIYGEKRNVRAQLENLLRCEAIN
jgi:hypothetical protein